MAMDLVLLLPARLDWALPEPFSMYLHVELPLKARVVVHLKPAVSR